MLFAREVSEYMELLIYDRDGLIVDVLNTLVFFLLLVE